MLGTYTFPSILSSCWLEPFILFNALLCLLLGETNICVLSKYCYPSLISIHILFLFAWNIFFHPFTFCMCVSLDLKWVSCGKLIYGSCIFLTYSAILYPLIKAYSLFTFKVTIDRYVHVTLLWIIFWVFFFF